MSTREASRRRGLLWKEWRSLRMLRRVGIGLGVLACAGLLAMRSAEGPAMASPWGRLTSEEIMLDAIPASIACMVWPLLALLLAVQSFGGDRAAGVETFLLERPVSRTRVWGARSAATLGSTGLVIAVTTLCGVLAIVGALGADHGHWTRPVRFAALGSVLSLLAALGGMAAGAIVSSQLAAVLGALLLSSTPLAIAWWLTLGFPWVRVADVPLGLVLPPLLYFFYPVASYVAVVTGEPAGRGRALRASLLLGLGAAGLLGSFATAAPLILRSVQGQIEVIPGRGGSALVEVDSGLYDSMWLLDTASGRRGRFLPPPTLGAAWKLDGTLVAVSTFAGRMGMWSEDARVDVYDRAGQTIGPPIQVEGVPGTPAWAGDDLLVAVSAGHGEELVLIDPGRGSQRTIFSRRGLGDLHVFSLQDGNAYVAILDDTTWTHSVHQVDAERATLGPAIGSGRGPAFRAGALLSPSGRYWRRPSERETRASGPEPIEIQDVATGSAHAPGTFEGAITWWAGDRLSWVSRGALWTWAPGEPARAIRALPTGTVELSASPDGQRLLVTVVRTRRLERGTGLESTVLTRLLLDESGRIAELRPWPSAPWRGLPLAYTTSWATPTVLARTGLGALALEPLAADTRVRPVFGDLPD